MITINNLTIYKCGFCRKKYEVKSACEKHETYCTRNPENHVACSGCIHFEEKTEELEMDCYFTRKVKFFFCNKHNQRMHPISAERRGVVGNYPEQFDESIRFPKECTDYQYFIN